MKVSIVDIDAHIEFLRDEARRLRESHSLAKWAREKAERMESIAELLRQVRQEHQMQGMDGERIE